MGDLWGLLLVAGLAAPLILLAATVLFLVWRADARSRREDDGPASAKPFLYPAVVRVVAWSCGATTFVLPWGIAIAVKLRLQSQGLPTHSWSSFLSPGAILVLIPVTLFLWAFPFPLLALFARYRYLTRVSARKTFKERLFVLGLTYLSGVTAGAYVYWSLFRDFDILYIFVPVGMYIAVPMLVGGFLAWWVIKLRNRMSAYGTASPGG